MLETACKRCDSPEEIAFHTKAMWRNGYSYQQIEDATGINYEPVRLCAVAGHMGDEEDTRIREWARKKFGLDGRTTAGVAKRTATAVAKREAEDPRERALNRLWVLEEHGIQLLKKMEQDEDFRGSVAAIEAVRRLVMDTARIENILTNKPNEEPTESVDTRALRESIMESFHQAKGALPRETSYEWKP